VGPRVGLDAVAKRKKSHCCPCRESNSGRPACSLISILTELPLILNVLAFSNSNDFTKSM
jgi:hypothetical protein